MRQVLADSLKSGGNCSTIKSVAWKKIFFKTADENKRIDEVLRRIRQGDPEAPLAETAKGQLKPSGPTGS